MSKLELVNPKFTIIGHYNDAYMKRLYPSKAEPVLADCPSAYVRDVMIKQILKNAYVYSRAFDFIAVDDDEGHRVSVHWLVEKPANEEKPLLVMNSHQDLELIVYASKNGNMVKCRCHNTDAALSLADNWIILGYDVEIDDAENYKVYFDSDFDLITVDEDGEYKAVYLVR